MNVKNMNGFTALMFAARNNHRKVVAALIKAGALIDLKNKQESTALILAAKKGNYEIMSMLIAANADVDAVDNDGSTPLILAAKWGHAESVKVLVQEEANKGVKHRGKTALMWSASKEVMQLLVGERGGHTLEAQEASQPLQLDPEALLWAAMHGKISEVESLLLAGRASEKDKVKFCAMANANVQDQKGKTALHHAALKGDVAAVEDILNHGTRLNTRYSQGETPLIFAANYGQDDVVQILADAKADLHVKTNSGNSAIMFAAAKNRAKIVGLLLPAKSDPIMMNQGGALPLFSPLVLKRWKQQNSCSEQELTQKLNIRAKLRFNGPSRRNETQF